MKIRHALIALALTAACGQALATPPVAFWQGNLPPLGENRIVGLWQAALTLAPCSGGPATSIHALNTFHAGGTLNSTDNAPQPSNGPAQGIWEYRGHGSYVLHVQFFTFLPDGTPQRPCGRPPGTDAGPALYRIYIGTVRPCARPPWESRRGTLR